MMNKISELGPEIAMGRNENLHTSGHAYRCARSALQRAGAGPCALLHKGRPQGALVHWKASKGSSDELPPSHPATRCRPSPVPHAETSWRR